MIRSERRKLKEKLGIKFESDKKKADQEIVIRDILIYRESKTTKEEGQFSFGELYHPSSHYAQLDTFKRLIDHISLIAEIAAKVHQHYYCQLSTSGAYEIKEKCYNNITRVALNEFALYTKQPLNLDQFNELMGCVEAIAKRHLENIHWVLSSLAVVTKDRKVLNICLYIQCGQEPVIHVVTKANFAAGDPTFAKTKYFTQKTYPSLKGKSSQFTAGEPNGVISNNGIFEITTRGGAKFLQIVDICLDYYDEHSIKNLLTLLDMTTSQRTDFLPKQVNHLITANTIGLSYEKNISTMVTLVDPIRSKRDMPKPITNDKFLTEMKINLASEYKHTVINKHYKTGALYLMSPPFGNHCRINIQPEQPIGNLSGGLEDKAKKYNFEVKQQFVDSLAYSKNAKIQQEFPYYLRELKELDTLIQSVCTIIPTELKLGSSSYRLKCRIQALHRIFNEKISSLITDPPRFLKEAGNLLKELGDHLERLYNREFQHPIIKHINRKIEYLIDEVFPASDSCRQSCIIS